MALNVEEWEKIAALIRNACQEICPGAPITIGECTEPDGWLVYIHDEPVLVTRTFNPHPESVVPVYTVMPLGLQYTECSIAYEGTELVAGIKEVVTKMRFDEIITNACAAACLTPDKVWRPHMLWDSTRWTRALDFGKRTVIMQRRKDEKWNGALYFDYREHTPPERQVVMWKAFGVDNVENLLSRARSSLIENMTCDAGRAYAEIVKNFGKVGITDPAVVQERVTAATNAILEEERQEALAETQGREG